MHSSKIALAALIALAPLPALAAAPANPSVERTAADRLTISWAGKGAVDVYASDRPDASADATQLISGNDRDGRHELVQAPTKRAYFILRDRASGDSVRVAERLLPLERGSNFRDIGGYPAADGKHVRWGMIFRSGGTPLLNANDIATVADLHLANLVDLRSTDERQLAPTKIEGVPYNAIGYSMREITASMAANAGTAQASVTQAGTGSASHGNGGALYRNLPKMLAPQMRLLFGRLVAKEGPVAFNCSAGQDRTGFATAMILSALGVPRDTIIADYHLSTTYRRPENEMPKFDPAAFPDNAAAQLFSRYRGAADGMKPQPLKEADGTAFLAFAFDEIERTYGSVEGYLAKEAGVTAADIATLRATYTE